MFRIRIPDWAVFLLNCRNLTELQYFDPAQPRVSLVVEYSPNILLSISAFQPTTWPVDPAEGDETEGGRAGNRKRGGLVGPRAGGSRGPGEAEVQVEPGGARHGQ